MRRPLLTGLLLAPLALFGCGGASTTEVVLVVRSDFDVPDEIDKIDVVITSPDGRTRTAEATFDVGEPGFPRTLGIERVSEREGAYSVTIEASFEGSVVLERKVRFEFTEDERRILEVHLAADCVGMICTGDTTCGDTRVCERPVRSTRPWDPARLTAP